LEFGDCDGKAVTGESVCAASGIIGGAGKFSTQGKRFGGDSKKKEYGTYGTYGNNGTHRNHS
jgi:hypothetical protein